MGCPLGWLGLGPPGTWDLGPLGPLGCPQLLVASLQWRAHQRPSLVTFREEISPAEGGKVSMALAY